MATELDPNRTHELGLKAVQSSDPDRFKIARDYYDEAREGFLAEGSLIDVGRVDRRLCPGLCRSTLGIEQCGICRLLAQLSYIGRHLAIRMLSQKNKKKVPPTNMLQLCTLPQE